MKKSIFRNCGLLLFVVFVLQISLLGKEKQVKIPKLPPAEYEKYFGSRIQRTMTLLSTSNKKARQTVKILFYGQSIVAGTHWRFIIKKLREKYPYANIVAENRAIGGFTAPSLVRVAVHDLYPCYPDLVIFHVYHGTFTGEHERIIYNIRKYTTAEIMIFTHQIAWVNEKSRFASRTKSDDKDSDRIRFFAQKYNCELIEVRREWGKFLTAHKIPINMLMGDTVHSNVHPNKKGHSLLAQLILRHFRLQTVFPGGWYNQVKKFEARRALEEKNDEINFSGAKWQRRRAGIVGKKSNSKLLLKFCGNRIDVVAIPCPNLGSAKILIDNKPPSAFPELYTISRPSIVYGGTRPALKRVTLGGKPLVEKWTLKIIKISEDAKDFTYSVTGAKTGTDGTGHSKKKFISKSGRIIIEPKDFIIAWAQKYRKKKCPVGFEVTWQVKANFLDIWRPKAIKDRSITDNYILAQGLTNGEHTLEIIPNGDGNIPVKELVVYCPPLR